VHLNALSDVRWPHRRRQRLYRLEYRLMGPVAVDAEEILFFPVPHPRSLSMEAHFPVPEYCSMALTTEIIYLLVHLFKLSRFSVYRHALVALRTREYTGCKGGRGNKEFSGDILFSCFGTETEE